MSYIGVVVIVEDYFCELVVFMCRLFDTALVDA